MLPHSLQAARELAGTGRLKAFSFDIFDTILFRRCTAPDGVYERAFQLLGLELSKPGMSEVYVQHRQIAEGKARKNEEDKNNYSEVSIDKIYEYFPVHIFGLSSSDLKRLVDAEFRAELDLCFGNAEIKDLLSHLRAQGIRVGFLSDTYWNAGQLTTLLRSCLPGLEWDFLYSSSDHRTSKSEKLFDHYLKDQKLVASSVAHLGDNPAADVSAPRRLGVSTILYPQGTLDLAAGFQRESSIYSLLCHHASTEMRQDGGLRVLRRAVAARLNQDMTPLQRYGCTYLGPVFTAFNRFAQARVDDLRAQGGQVKTVFLARDGLLPFDVWNTLESGDAAYVEINRRIAVIGGSSTLEPLQEFFRHVPMINRQVVEIFLKVKLPAITRFFQSLPAPGVLPGTEFADKLPELIRQADIDRLAVQVRRQVVNHLRAAVPDLDQCTDLVLVDLGYSGTVQKSLHTILRKEGLSTRLHGVYLITADEAFLTLSAGDSAVGLVDDWIMPPASKRVLLSNVALLEQVCSAPVGSVAHYNDDGSVDREDDPRDPAQIESTAEIRRGVLSFARQARELVAAGFPDPFADPCRITPYVAAILGRALLFPTDDELVLLGAMKHDLNLGSQVLLPMADPSYMQSLLVAKAMPYAFSPHEPPMWMAGSLAAISPMYGFLYTLHGAGLLSADATAEAACDEAEVLVLSEAGGKAIKVTVLRDGEGELRLHLPLLRDSNALALAIPAAVLPVRGLLRSVSIQQGKSIKHALRQLVETIDVARFEGDGVVLSQGLFSVTDPNGHLVVPLPQLVHRMALVSVGIVPLDGNRILVQSD